VAVRRGGDSVAKVYEAAPSLIVAAGGGRLEIVAVQHNMLESRYVA
jgi:hypothetical protein